MKKLIGLLFFPVLLYGQVSNSVLWEITNPTLSDTSYVLGTIHIPQAKFFYVNDHLEQVKKKVDAAYFELLEDEEAMKRIVGRLMAQDGESVKELLSKKEYKRVKRFFRKNDFKNLLILNQVKPIILTQIVTQSIIESDTILAMDMLLQREFLLMKKNVYALESYDDQLSVLLSATVGEQATELVNMINNIDSVTNELQFLSELYLRQDLLALDSLLSLTDTINGISLEVLNSKRNLKMIPKIEKAMQEESVLIAIGVAHLVGEKGILELLRARGYQIRALN